MSSRRTSSSHAFASPKPSYLNPSLPVPARPRPSPPFPATSLILSGVLKYLSRINTNWSADTKFNLDTLSDVLPYAFLAPLIFELLCRVSEGNGIQHLTKPNHHLNPPPSLSLSHTYTLHHYYTHSFGGV